MMNIYSVSFLFFMAAATLSGCHQNPSHPNRDGSIKEIVWPAPEKAKLGTGIGVFPVPENINLINEGMTKDQIYLLIGSPHFGELFFTVKEWDYLFYFRKINQGKADVTTCQFKIIYNSDNLVSGIYWKTVSPKGEVCPLYSEKQNRDNENTFSVNVFFNINQYKLDKINYSVLSILDKTMSDIREKGEYESISVYGYTDRQGDRDYNMKLSALRAKSVADYFIDNGFPRNKVFSKGMGESTPTTSCFGLRHEQLTECLLPDRKVIIVVNHLRNSDK